MKLLKGAIRHIKTSSTNETQVSTRFRLPGYMFGAGLDDGSKEVFDRLQSTFKRLVSLQREKEVVDNKTHRRHEKLSSPLMGH